MRSSETSVRVATPLLLFSLEHETCFNIFYLEVCESKVMLWIVHMEWGTQSLVNTAGSRQEGLMKLFTGPLEAMRFTIRSHVNY